MAASHEITCIIKTVTLCGSATRSARDSRVRVLWSELELGAESGFLNHGSAVHKTCENSSLQTFEISACQN